MKKEEFYEVLSELDEEDIQKAGSYTAKKKPLWMAFAAVLVLAAIVTGVVFRGHLSGKNAAAPSPGGVMTVLAAEPEKTAEGMSADQFLNGQVHYNWWSAYLEKLQKSSPLRQKMEPCYRSLMEKLLPQGDENTVCSPLNIYLAFAMLAETTGGQTRAEILDVLGVSDIEALRANANALWESNCVDTPVLKSQLANSIWLSDKYSFNDSTLNLLAEKYHASSFRGTAGSPELDEALRTWTDAHTGGLLKEYSKTLSIKPETVMELLSTIYYKASWLDNFLVEANTRETFHGTKGDSTVDMMHREEAMAVYETDAFISISLNLSDSGSMLFYLPKEGIRVEDLAGSPDVLKAAAFEANDENRSFKNVRLAVPKFDISGETDLLNIMQELGIKSALSAGDFSPLVNGGKSLYVSEARHAARLSIDENGVEGAAYTVIAADEGALEVPETVDFILDRPFLFLITGQDGSVLFAGLTRNV